jgi:trehalose 6-phosphate synthase/phosphatase
MGIDFARYHNALDDSRVSELASRLEAEKQGRRVLLSIDRLDYTKGIPQRLLAYEEFLKRYPQWRERVVLVMVVTPSRVDVEQYCLMKRQLDETVGHINGKFATLTWTPVIYQFRALDAVELAAYYAISDAALVTPLRDGMNLIAKEYVASRKDGTGVLILSGMAGAAKELGEAIIINPNDVISSARAINEAFEMHADEQKRRNRIMQVRLRRYDVVRWAEEFLAALQRAHDAQHELRARILGAKDCELIIGAYRAAKRRVLLLDYDGTLVEFARLPELAQPDQWLLETLQALATSATVVIVSGRDRATLESWFGALPVELIAEHGAMVRTSDGWTVDGVLDTKWKANIAPILERYADRLPGAFVEEKEFSLAYHYRLADPALASVRTKELLDDLTSFTANIDVQVLQGNKVIEVRCAGASKGRAALRLAQEHDFVLAIGDDIADEDLFSSLPSAHTIRVGIVPSSARHNLPSVKDVRRLLGELARS